MFSHFEEVGFREDWCSFVVIIFSALDLLDEGFEGDEFIVADEGDLLRTLNCEQGGNGNREQNSIEKQHMGHFVGEEYDANGRTGGVSVRSSDGTRSIDYCGHCPILIQFNRGNCGWVSKLCRHRPFRQRMRYFRSFYRNLLPRRLLDQSSSISVSTRRSRDTSLEDGAECWAIRAEIR